MLTLKEIQENDNLTPLFYEIMDGESKLSRIGQQVINGYKIDEDSRKEWKDTVDKAMDIAKQVMTEKNFPWPKASNIKFPLICEAAIDFAARVGPEIIPNDRIVQCAITGKEIYKQVDPNQPQQQSKSAVGEKSARAERVSKYMSYQLLSSPDWREGVDSLLQILPIVGTVFKKTYYSTLEKRVISEVCSPDDIVVNYDTKSLETARRVTHKIRLSINDVIERQRRGLFNDRVSIEELRPESCDSNDDDYEIDLLEQHCWYDLDYDDYKEPYVVTVHPTSGKVLRLVNRIDYLEKNDKGQVLCIKEDQYFSDYHFIRSMDGGFYSIGFGQLLLPLNRGINTLFNQLIDCGTLSVTQGGLLGKGLRLRDAIYKFNPFEYKVVDTATGSKIADSVYQFPVREPSATLFNLLTLMIQIGKDLTSATEAVNGDLTGSNVSDKTMNSLIEQGTKIFNAIYKRTLLGQEKEYKKIYKLNYYNLTNKEYRNILDEPDANVKDDFDLDSNDVRPVADPIFSSMSQKISKIQVLMNLPTIDPRARDDYALRALQFDDEQINVLLPPLPPPQPPAKDIKDMAQAEQAKAQAQLLGVEAQLKVQNAPLEIALNQGQLKVLEAQIEESVARVWKMQADKIHGDQKLLIAGGKMQQQESLKQTTAEHMQKMDAVGAIQKEKDLQIKAAKVASDSNKANVDALLENKKLDIEREKIKNDDGKSGSE
jgi:chaperonin GroES